MNQEANSALQPENNLLAIFEWLQLANGRSDSDDAEQLLKHLLLLRDTPTPTRQRMKILDLIYRETQRVVFADLPKLLEINLPVSRKIRQRVRTTQDILDALTQEYFNTLSELFDPQGTPASSPPQTTLTHITHCLSWHIRISHLAAAPNPVGLWQKLHSAFHSARRLGVERIPGSDNGFSVEQIYTGTLLTAMAQPASFCAKELEFIVEYVESSLKPVEILETIPANCNGVFWLDLERDFPAHALVRRNPPGDAPILYFAGDAPARQAGVHLAALEQGVSSNNLGLPAFAETHAGLGVLRRLQYLWGNPTKRKFPRRRQSYRINLCSGLEQLWHLIREPERANEISEWMVTNESPDGYSLMHMSGETACVRVGDIVAVQAKDERTELKPLWHVCLVRWALSENPEHIELGLQQLASHVIAAELARPRELDSRHIPALILPKMPPLRPHTGIVVQTGSLPENPSKLILLIEKENLEIREVSRTELAEQTASIEVFNVASVETP